MLEWESVDLEFSFHTLCQREVPLSLWGSWCLRIEARRRYAAARTAAVGVGNSSSLAFLEIRTSVSKRSSRYQNLRLVVQQVISQNGCWWVFWQICCPSSELIISVKEHLIQFVKCSFLKLLARSWWMLLSMGCSLVSCVASRFRLFSTFESGLLKQEAITLNRIDQQNTLCPWSNLSFWSKKKR